jgi:hypothetical protein
VDGATRGNWKGTYGSGTNGVLLLGQATNLTAGTTVGWSGGSYFTLNAKTPSPFALERVGNTLPTDRFLGCYFSPTNLTVNVSLPSGVTNTLALYLVLAEGRSERVDLINPGNSNVLSSQTVTGSSNGVYLVWAVNGSVQAKVTRLAGANAMISAVFIGNGTGAPVVRTQPPASIVVGGGGATAFGASASGLPALYYQWRKNGVPVADGACLRGATAPVLQLVQVGVAEAGDYTLVVTNVYGRATSTVCRVTVDRVASLQDLNSDGIDDFIWQDPATTLVGAWLMPGKTWHWIAPANNGNWKIAGLADLNADGTNDLIWQDSVTTQVGAWLMPAETWLWIAPGDNGTWQVVATADLNGDGNTDLLWQDSTTTQVGAWLMPAKTWQWIAPANNGTWKVVAVADLNADGYADLLWQDSATTLVGAWLMPAKTWQWIAASSNGTWKLVGAADLNADGVPDLLWQDSATTQVGAWMMPDKTWQWIAPGNNAGWRINGRDP